MKIYPAFILFFLWLPASQLSYAQSISDVVNTYHRVTAINTTTNTLTLNTTAGLSPGMKVVVIQMKGATIETTNNSNFGNITAIGNAGNYEFNYICSINGNEVILTQNLLRTYTVTGMVQLVSVPRYVSVTVTDTLKAAPWDPVTATGGVLAIEARSVTLNAPVYATGMGFLGGEYVDHPQPPYNCDWGTNITAYAFPNPASGFQTGGIKGEGIADAAASLSYGRGKLANGGGGANNHNSGGAGGSNYGEGGSGGQRSNEGAFNCHGSYPGIAGITLSSYGYSAGNNRLFLGGGGGAGHGNNNVGMSGGNGGGIIFIRADTVYANNHSIQAEGARPYRGALIALIGDGYTAGGDGGGGGGGGGVIVFDVGVTQSPAITLSVNGANGSNSSYTPSNGCFGPGGGGGAGVIWIRQGSLAAGENATVTGGTNGVVSVTTSVVACRGLANGATAGSSGLLALNYVPPMGPTVVCAPLPDNELLNFQGRVGSRGVILEWSLSTTENMRSFEVERAPDARNFKMQAKVTASSNKTYECLDENAIEGILYYRLRIVYLDGSQKYSNVISIKNINKKSLTITRLNPNPAREEIQVAIISGTNSRAEVTIINSLGIELISQPVSLVTGSNTVKMNVAALTAGTYFLVLKEGIRRAQAAFVIR